MEKMTINIVVCQFSIFPTHICKSWIFTKYWSKCFCHLTLYCTSRSLNCLKNHGTLFFYMLDVPFFYITHILLLEFISFSLSLPWQISSFFCSLSIPSQKQTTHPEKSDLRFCAWDCFLKKNYVIAQLKEREREINQETCVTHYSS